MRAFFAPTPDVVSLMGCHHTPVLSETCGGRPACFPATPHCSETSLQPLLVPATGLSHSQVDDG